MSTWLNLKPSSLSFNVFQLKNKARELLEMNNKMLHLLASCKGSHYSLDDSTSLDDVMLHTLVVPSLQEKPIPTYFLKQQSEDWFSIRKHFRVTGSTLHGALGLETLKKQQLHIQKVTQST